MPRYILLALIAILVSPVLSLSQDISSTVTDQKYVEVQVVLSAAKEKYKRTDEIALNAMLVNRGPFPVFLYANLEWGGLASFSLCVRDAKGSLVRPRAFADADPFLENLSDTTQYVKLGPLHFLGSTYKTSARDLNIDRPGRYSLVVQFSPLVPRAKVGLKPFLGIEDGIMQSNILIIEIE